MITIRAKITKTIYVDLVRDVVGGTFYECNVCSKRLQSGDIAYTDNSVLTIVCPECAKNCKVK